MIEIKDKSLKDWKFIDLFAGIGGFHYAISSFGAKCVMASEWDKHAMNVYYTNHKVKPLGDITCIDEEDIPKHDILAGGFPCQAFSISGKQKGFEDTRGTLFFDVARIVDKHKPKILFLENVKNFIRHDNGNTIKVVQNTLKQLGYEVFIKVLNTSNYGLPQNRERVFIIGFRQGIRKKDFKFPESLNKKVSLNEFLEEDISEVKIVNRRDIKIYKNPQLTPSLFNDFEIPNRPLQIGTVNKGGQGERIYHPNGHAVTLSAYGGGVGSKTGLYYIDGKIRKLTPRECANIQGFPKSFKLHENKNQSYKQFGNSVSVDVLQHILKKIVYSVE